MSSRDEYFKSKIICYGNPCRNILHPFDRKMVSGLQSYKLILKKTRYYCKHRQKITSDDVIDSNITEENEGIILPRETHPFVTYAPLVGGGKKKKKQGDRSNRGKFIRGNKRNREGAFNGRMLGVDPVLGPNKLTALTYIDGSDVRQFPLQNWGSWSIKCNDVYDPDPLIGTGGITGYAECVAFWSTWLVSACELDCSFVSNEPAISVKVAVVVSPLAITSSLTSKAACDNAIERWGAIWVTSLGETTGASRAVMPKKIVIPERVVGDNAYYHAGTYNGATTTSPSSIVYVTFILTCATGAALTNGVNYTGRFTYRVKFFRIQSTLLGRDDLLKFLLLFREHQLRRYQDRFCDFSDILRKIDLLFNPPLEDAMNEDGITLRQPEVIEPVENRIERLEKMLNQQKK
jgi:hypothetical protein